MGKGRRGGVKGHVLEFVIDNEKKRGRQGGSMRSRTRFMECHAVRGSFVIPRVLGSIGSFGPRLWPSPCLGLNG